MLSPPGETLTRTRIQNSLLFSSRFRIGHPPVDLQVMSLVNNYDAKKNVWCPPEDSAAAGESRGAPEPYGAN